MTHRLPRPPTTDLTPSFTDPLYPDATFVVHPTCAIRGSYVRSKHEGAHAHCGNQPHYGLVCIKPEYADDAGLRAHEYAHLLNDRADVHGANWQRIVTELGHPDHAASYRRTSYGPRRKAVTLVWYEPDGTPHRTRLLAQLDCWPDLTIPRKGERIHFTDRHPLWDELVEMECNGEEWLTYDDVLDLRLYLGRWRVNFDDDPDNPRPDYSLEPW